MRMILKDVALIAVAACLACYEPAEEDRTAAGNPATDTAAAAPGRIANTPPGGLEDWVRDITVGLQDVPTRVATDAAGAQRQALDLYIGRQEFIEMYWGPGRSLHPSGDPALGEAVLSAETKFHELLQLLAVQPVDTVRVRVEVDSLSGRLARVIELAKASQAVMVPPGKSAVSGSQE